MDSTFAVLVGAFVAGFYGVALSPFSAMILEREFDPQDVIQGLALFEYKLWVNIFLIIPVFFFSFYNWLVYELYLEFFASFLMAFVGQLFGTLALGVGLNVYRYFEAARVCFLFGCLCFHIYCSQLFFIWFLLSFCLLLVYRDFCFMLLWVSSRTCLAI